MAVEVRAATALDEDGIFALLPQLLELLGEEMPPNDAARQVFRSLLNSERGAVLVAVEDGRLLGVITMSFVPAIRYGGTYCQLEELVVDAGARGRNAGAALVMAAIDTARARGCREIGLYAIERNRPFYERFGFTYAGPELRRRLD